MCKKCHLLHSPCKPCIKDLTDFIRENNYLQWSLTKELQRRNKKYDRLKNMSSLIRFLENMENDYRDLVEKRNVKIKEEILDRALDFDKEVKDRLEELKQKEDQRMSSFSFFKTRKTEAQLHKQAVEMTEQKLEDMAAVCTWELENFEGIQTITITRFCHQFIQELNKAQKEVILKMKDQAKEVNDEFYEKIRKETERRMELKIKEEQLKIEIMKNKNAAERMAQMAKWKAKQAQIKQQENKVFKKIQQQSEEEVKQVFRGKTFYANPDIATKDERKLIEITRNVGFIQKRIQRMQNETKLVNNHNALLVHLAERGGVLELTIGSFIAPSNYFDIRNTKQYREWRMGIHSKLQAAISNLVNERTSYEKKLRQFK
jgi:hypothetical protein